MAETGVMTQAEIHAAYTLPHKCARYGNVRVDLTDLLYHRSSYQPVRCHISSAFEALRWMSDLAERHYSSGRKRVHPVCELLSRDRGVDSCPQFCEIAFGPAWADPHYGLAGIFDVLLLSEAGGEVAAWRARHKLAAHRRHVIRAPATASIRKALYPHGYGESLRTVRTLDRLLGFSGDFAFSPNECHPRARWAYEIKLCLPHHCGGRWEVRANYSYHGDPGSSWYVLVAQQQPREAFHWFVDRALSQLRNMCGVIGEVDDG